MPGTTTTITASPSAPSRIFIIRHGARLDAADKDWSESSPTPYDTPLTYGGWIQSRNLGVRIASLLQSNQPQATSPSKKKRTRVVIHSSPFLRCIQTAVSIASGLAQHHHQQLTEALWTVDENGDLAFNEPSGDPERFVKPVLRLDAFLGEWMTMDYYTDISPPPVSQLMVNTARNEYMSAPIAIPRNITKSPHLSAHDSVLPTSVTGGFVPPSPSYAASTNGMIPRGYVSQAKDYVDFDYAWDATRLGQGAELGEEWSAMHKRFRSGWGQMMRFYNDSDPIIATSTTTSRFSQRLHAKQHDAEKRSHGGSHGGIYGNPTPPPSDSEEEDDIDKVVIVVTHGAGCNALLGAITDKPVLIDIGICSLTMGVLSTSPPSPRSAQKPDSLHLPFTYDLKLTANTEHMRPSSGSSTSTPPISPFLGARPRNASGLGTFVLSSSGLSAAAFGGLKTQRSASTGHGSRPSGGLWTMPRPEDRERPRSRGWVEDSSAVVVEKLEALVVDERMVEMEVIVVEEEEKGLLAAVHMERSHTTSEINPAGLWAARAWDRPTKRRWTVGKGDVWAV